MEDTDERKKQLRSERNRRYRENKKATAKLANSANPPIQPIEGVKLQNHTLDKKTRHEIASLIFKVVFSIFITVLLCKFQAETYVKDGMMKPLSWAISIVCETALCYLSVSLRSSFVSLFLWLSVFSYSLATMSYGLLKTKAEKTSLVLYEKTLEDEKNDVLSKAKIAFDISLERGQVTNARNLLKDIETLSDEAKRENLPKIETDEAKRLINYEAIGLIILRAILMILNALLIHRIFFHKKYEGV